VVTLANFGPIWSPVPYLVVQQNAMPFSGEFLGRLGRRSRIEWRLRGLLCVGAMRAATINVTPSASLADLIRAAHPSLAARPFRVLPHGTDLSRFSPRDPDPGPGRSFAFICPTTLEAYKGMEILLEATRLLHADGHRFEVRVTASDRGWPTSIQQAIEAHRGAPYFENVRYIGAQPADRMPEAYRSADALLYPSLCESFGFPLLESMACGLPIVAGDLDVNRELCADAAQYYPAKSPRACAQAMALVLGDPEHRRSLREAATRRVQGRDWSWSTYARQFVEICEATIEAGSGPKEPGNRGD
jgi:glycosyltransferase involved in cell wall biosynthesis